MERQVATDALVRDKAANLILEMEKLRIDMRQEATKARKERRLFGDALEELSGMTKDLK